MSKVLNLVASEFGCHILIKFRFGDEYFCILNLFIMILT